jgi:hypothetical protein
LAPEAPRAGKRGDFDLLFFSKEMQIYKSFGFEYFEVVI